MEPNQIKPGIRSEMSRESRQKITVKKVARKGHRRDSKKQKTENKNASNQDFRMVNRQHVCPILPCPAPCWTVLSCTVLQCIGRQKGARVAPLRHLRGERSGLGQGAAQRRPPGWLHPQGTLHTARDLVVFSSRSWYQDVDDCCALETRTLLNWDHSTLYTSMYGCMYCTPVCFTRSFEPQRRGPPALYILFTV